MYVERLLESFCLRLCDDDWATVERHGAEEHLDFIRGFGLCRSANVLGDCWDYR